MDTCIMQQRDGRWELIHGAPACISYKPQALGHGHTRGLGSFSKITGT